MFRLSRLNGPVVVAALFLVSLVFVDGSLLLCLGATSRWLPGGEVPSDTKVLKVNGEVLSGVVREGKPVGIGTKVPLGVLLGQSTLGAGVNAEIVDQNDGLSIKWLNLHGWGGSILQTSPIADLVFVSNLKPDVVVFAINPYMLIGHNFEVENVPQGRLMAAIKPWVWTYSNRVLINNFYRGLAHRLRLGIYRRFGQGISELYVANPTPWHRAGRRPDGHSMNSQELAERSEACEKLGWYDPDRYSPDNINSQTLVEMIRRFRRDGAKVIIFLMPERSTLRMKIPPEAVRCFDKINEAYFRDDPVPVFDLRDRITDDLFADLDHVSAKGTEPVSLLLAKRLHEALSAEFPDTDRDAARPAH